MKTRAVVMPGPGRVELEERELPAIGPDQVLVQIRVGGICRSDLGMFRGEEDDYPFFAGHESAGVVSATGSAVTSVQPGDNVAVLGSRTLSQFVVAPERAVAKLSDDIADWSSWVVEPMACAVNGVDVAGIRPDDLVGVVGCGFMGQLVIRASRITPVREILAFDISERALASARDSGADRTIPSGSDPDGIVAEVEGSVSQRRRSPSPYEDGNGPLDVVFEASGTAAGLELASRLVRMGGTLVMFGHQRGSVAVDGTRWHMNGIRVLNASPMIASDFFDLFQRTAGMMNAKRLSLSGLVSHAADYKEAQAAFESFTGASYMKGVILF